MDWPQNYTGLSDKDLNNVFKYERREATVMHIMRGEEPKTRILQSDGDWNEWLTNECPTPDLISPGLVLIIAKRPGERQIGGTHKVLPSDWLDKTDVQMPKRASTPRMLEQASLGGKPAEPRQGEPSSSGGKRQTRTLPFSRKTFERVAVKFFMHKSIAKVISRADIPVFSCDKVRMGEPNNKAYEAYVFNLRTSNAWERDLALTATYFPSFGVTFATVFGCCVSTEDDIMRRLSSSAEEAMHPLILPGILTEVERIRHIHLVETTIDELEARIFELDADPDSQAMERSEIEKKNTEKRNAWLDAAYLRNCLISWNTQMAKIKTAVDEVRYANPQYKSNEDIDFETRRKSRKSTAEHLDKNLSPNYGQEKEPDHHTFDWDTYQDTFQETSRKIKSRNDEIIEEYEDKIRDCTMRLDGMAIATQWTQGETNMEIAKATSRDSKHMRSIALVTMIFLPGTFFAGMFSMTFFNWSGGDGEAIVSGYFWIYVVVTVVFTLLTLGLWYYFNILRQSYRFQKSVKNCFELSRVV